MKVLIVQPHMSFHGGAETVVMHLSRELNKMGADNSILTLSLCEEISALCKDLNFILPEKKYTFLLQNPNLLKSLMRLAREIRMLTRLIRQNSKDFDIINIHNFPATWAAGFSGCKNLVWMCNEPPDLWNRQSKSLFVTVIRNVVSRIDRLIVSNAVNKICVADEINAGRIRARYGRDVEIVPYGIECEIFCSGDKETAQIKYGLKGKFVIVQIGTITPEKNQAQSINAVQELKNKIPNICLLLAGPGNNAYQKSLEEYVDKNDLKRHVRFLGALTKKEIAGLYAACDAAVFPVKTQGGWLAPFETLCAGKPVIVSSTMGAASIIKKEGLGTIAGDYAQAIRDIYDNPGIFLARAIQGRDWVKENLTWRKFAERKYKIFGDLLEKEREKS